MDNKLQGESVDQPEAQEVMEEIQSFTFIDPVKEDGKKSDYLPIFGMLTHLDKAGLTKVATKIAGNKTISESEKKELLVTIRNAARGKWDNDEIKSIFETGVWSQYIEVDGEKLTPKFVSTNIKAGADNRLSGVTAVRHIASSTGTGRINKSYLWHSGIVLMLGIFKKEDILNLVIRILEERMEVGTDTKGSLFTADDVHTTTLIVEFILDHVIDCNIKDYTIPMLRELLLVADIPTLQAGALAGMYPSGYPFVNICKDYGDTCSYNTLEQAEDSSKLPKLDFRKLCVVDGDRLDRTARRHMKAPMGSHTKEQVIAYQEAVNVTENVSVPLNDTGTSIYRVVMQLPTYELYRNESRVWLADIEHMVNTALSGAEDLDRRTYKQRRFSYIKSHMKRLGAQRQSPWIKSISIATTGDDNYIIENRPSILDSISELSKNSELREAITDAVEKYKFESIFAFTGMPNYACPMCGKSQLPDGSPRPTLIPVNPASYFFDIMVLSQLQA